MFHVFRVACRFDCASKYELEIELWSKDLKILEQHKIKKQWRQWDCNMWQKVDDAFVFRVLIRVRCRRSLWSLNLAQVDDVLLNAKDAVGHFVQSQWLVSVLWLNYIWLWVIKYSFIIAYVYVPFHFWAKIGKLMILMKNDILSATQSTLLMCS